MSYSFRRLFTLSLYPTIDTTLYMDTLDSQEETPCTGEQHEAGGKGPNVSRALAARGIQCPCIAVLPQLDRERFLHLMQEAGAQVLALPIPGSIRENLTLVTSTRQHRIMRQGAPFLRGQLEELQELLERTICAGDLVLVGGKLPPELDTQAFADLCRRIRGRGAALMLDTTALPLAGMKPLEIQLCKPNRHELADLTGMPCDTIPQILLAAERMLEQGVQELLVSIDADGALYLTAEQRLFVRAPRVQVRSAVGAGDCLLAEFVARRMRGALPAESLRYGVAAGSACCMQYGSAIADPAEIAALYRHTEVQVLERPTAL